MPRSPSIGRFIRWTDKDSGDPEVMSYLSEFRDALTWEDLLAKHRVVVLAEAGSGKSTELAEQARLSGKAGSYTFFTTVQNVGRRGLSNAIGRAASLKLEEWRNSDQPAWFFFDSVDEAKASDVRLDEALREIADGIEGGAARAHVVLSGRHTDWEFTRDLERLQTWIAMPPANVAAPVIDPNELIVSVLRRDKPAEPPPPAEAPLVVVMAALDRGQVETFARAKGVANVDAFFLELDKANLWDFARRPLDLDWMVDYGQGATVASLPHEVDVQRWVADRLRSGQGRSYSVEREPHVVEEKEPDIRIRAKASDANAPVKIKVAESWTLEELEDALSVQLVGRYLRDRHNRYGILLLVHQEARQKGWQTPTGDFLKFEQAVRLKARLPFRLQRQLDERLHHPIQHGR